MGESKYNLIRGGHDFYVARHINDLFTGRGRMVIQFYSSSMYVTDYIFTKEDLYLLFDIIWLKLGQLMSIWPKGLDIYIYWQVFNYYTCPTLRERSL